MKFQLSCAKGNNHNATLKKEGVFITNDAETQTIGALKTLYDAIELPSLLLSW
jgi:hypothetical protein